MQHRGRHYSLGRSKLSSSSHQNQNMLCTSFPFSFHFHLLKGTQGSAFLHCATNGFPCSLQEQKSPISCFTKSMFRVVFPWLHDSHSKTKLLEYSCQQEQTKFYSTIAFQIQEWYFRISFNHSCQHHPRMCCTMR